MDLIFSRICYKKLNVMLLYSTFAVLLFVFNKFFLELSFDNQTFVTLYVPFSFGSLPYLCSEVISNETLSLP